MATLNRQEWLPSVTQWLNQGQGQSFFDRRILTAVENWIQHCDNDCMSYHNAEVILLKCGLLD